MKVVFMGTPDFAVPSLKLLLEEHQVLAVVTQPDRQKGRGKKTVPPVVKTVAEAAGVPVLQPEKIKTCAEELKALGADLFVVVAFGQILPESVLAIPPLGCINIHGSLLPKLRGAAPIQWSIINGETKTGVTAMFMAKGMDTGDMILKKEMEINADDTYGSLSERMSHIGAQALRETLALLAAGKVAATPQNEADATYAPMISKDLEHLDWSAPASRLCALLRGLSPSPGAYTLYEGEKLKIWAMEPAACGMSGAPGQVLEIEKDGFSVQAGDGAVRITEVQGPGGKRMPAAAYLRGHAIERGKILG